MIKEFKKSKVNRKDKITVTFEVTVILGAKPTANPKPSHKLPSHPHNPKNHHKKEN